MKTRFAALIIGALDAVAWLLAAGAMFFSHADHATKGLDAFAGLVITALFALTAAPALVLAGRGTHPRLALLLALAFPAVFVVLLIVAVTALP